MTDNDAPRAALVWTPRVQLAGFIKGSNIHCYAQNIKTLCVVVSETKIFEMFSALFCLC